MFKGYKNFILSAIFIFLLSDLSWDLLKAQAISTNEVDSLQFDGVYFVIASDTILDSIFYFTRSIELRLIADHPKDEIFYSTYNAANDSGFIRYKQPLLINQSAVLRTFAVSSSNKKTSIKKLTLIKIENLQDFEIFCDKKPCLNISRKFCLFDGVVDASGNENNFLNLIGEKIELEVNFGVIRNVNSLKIHYFTGESPDYDCTRIVIEGSEDGKNFFTIGLNEPLSYSSVPIWKEIILQNATVRYARICFYIFCEDIEKNSILIDEVVWDFNE